MAPACKAIPPVVSFDIFTPVAVPLPLKHVSNSAACLVSSGRAPAAEVTDGGDSATTRSARQIQGGGGHRTIDCASGDVKGDSKKNTKKNKNEGESGGAPAAAAAGKDHSGKWEDKKCAGGVGAGAAAGFSGDPSKLDVRVGVIVKAWGHPESQKLYCEEVDLGEVRVATERKRETNTRERGSRGVQCGCQIPYPV